MQYHLREKTEAEKRWMKEYTVEEALYAEDDPHSEPDDTLRITADDLDPDKRPSYLTWPLEIDRIRQQKIEKRLGMHPKP